MSATKIGSKLRAKIADHTAIVVVIGQGYVGLSVAFSLGVGALLTGEVDSRLARAMRPWVLGAWILLTLGIYRVVLEAFMVVFRIYEETKKIREKAESQA